MRAIPVRVESILQAIDELDRPKDVMTRKEYRTYLDASRSLQEFEVEYSVGMTVELHFSAGGDEVAEVDFLSNRAALAWHNGSVSRMSPKILALIRKHGFTAYTRFDLLPRNLKEQLMDA